MAPASMRLYRNERETASSRHACSTVRSPSSIISAFACASTLSLSYLREILDGCSGDQADSERPSLGLESAGIDQAPNFLWRNSKRPGGLRRQHVRTLAHFAIDLLAVFSYRWYSNRCCGFG